MTHYRQAQRLTPSSRHLAKASRGTAMGSRRAWGFLAQTFILAQHPLHQEGPHSPCPQGWSEPPGGAVMAGGGAAWLCPGITGRGVLQEEVLPQGQPGGPMREEAQWEEAMFPLPNGENPTGPLGRTTGHH